MRQSRPFVDVTTIHGILVLNGDGSFTYTPTTGYLGPDSFTYHAFDGLDSGNVAKVTLNVGDVTPPVVTSPGDQTSTEGDSVILQIVATDPDDTVLNYVATGLPQGLSIDAGTGLITGTVVSTFDQHGPYTVLVTVSDPAGNTGTASFNWTVDNVAPVVLAHEYGTHKNTPLIVDSADGRPERTRPIPGARLSTPSVDSRPRMVCWFSTATVRSPTRPTAGYFGPDSFTYHAL